MEVLDLKDEDLIIDLKLGKVGDIRNIYEANAANLVVAQPDHLKAQKSEHGHGHGHHP